MSPAPARKRRQPEVISPGGAPADLEQAVADLGIRITGADDDEVKGFCPEHARFTGKEDSNPSWSVNRETGLHNCWSCPYQGSFITLVVDQLDVDLWEAARWIRQYGFNLESIESLPDYEDRDLPKKRATAEITESDLAQFGRPPADVLAVRGISAEAARYYGVLWDDARTSWILPIRMPDGVLIGWQRKGEKRLGADNVVKNWPKSIPKSLTLFGADVFPVGETAVVLESPLDCVRLLSAGMTGGVATFGDKFSEEQMRVLRDLTDEVVWATDNDAAGLSAARIFRDGEPFTKRPAYSRRFQARYLDYGMLPADAKDIGTEGVADIHILRAVRGAKHALLADLGASDVSREVKAVPRTGQTKNGRPGVNARRNGAGYRKDTNNNRRRGGSGRRIR